MRSCRDITRLASDRLERRLSWGERIEFHLHLMICRLCRRYVGQLAMLRRAASRLGDGARVATTQLPSAARARIAARLRTAARDHADPAD